MVLIKVLEPRGEKNRPRRIPFIFFSFKEIKMADRVGVRSGHRLPQGCKLWEAGRGQRPDKRTKIQMGSANQRGWGVGLGVSKEHS